ncbi:MAG TPA: hypothetical protein VH681_05890, partial [Nitrospiraceae bacterium]
MINDGIYMAWICVIVLSLTLVSHHALSADPQPIPPAPVPAPPGKPIPPAPIPPPKPEPIPP